MPPPLVLLCNSTVHLWLDKVFVSALMSRFEPSLCPQDTSLGEFSINGEKAAFSTVWVCWLENALKKLLGSFSSKLIACRHLLSFFLPYAPFLLVSVFSIPDYLKCGCAYSDRPVSLLICVYHKDLSRNFQSKTLRNVCWKTHSVSGLKQSCYFKFKWKGSCMWSFLFQQGKIHTLSILHKSRPIFQQIIIERNKQIAESTPVKSSLFDIFIQNEMSSTSSVIQQIAFLYLCKCIHMYF